MRLRLELHAPTYLHNQVTGGTEESGHISNGRPVIFDGSRGELETKRGDDDVELLGLPDVAIATTVDQRRPLEHVARNNGPHRLSDALAQPRSVDWWRRPASLRESCQSVNYRRVAAEGCNSNIIVSIHTCRPRSPGERRIERRAAKHQALAPLERVLLASDLSFFGCLPGNRYK